MAKRNIHRQLQQKGIPMQWRYFTIGLMVALLSGAAWGQESFPAAKLGVSDQIESTAPIPDLETNLFPLGNGTIASEDFSGGRRGYLNPFLSVSGFYTDNLFQSANNEQSDRYTLTVPGLWISLPARNQRAMEKINTSNIAPGGLPLSRFTTKSESRFQGDVQYQAEIRNYDRNPKEDRVDHRGEGIFKVALRGGLSLELADVYVRNSDPYGTGGRNDRTTDTFDSNLLNVIFISPLSSKLQLRLDYGNYHLAYEDDRNLYRDRDDNSYSGYIFFQTTPKTAVFIQGEYITINYNQGINVDSHQSNYYLGAQMQTSAKSRGRIRVGYGAQKYSGNQEEDRHDFLAEVQLNYAFTPKTSAYLQGTRRLLESDQIGAKNILAHNALLGYRQRIMNRWQGDANIFYNRNEYQGTVTIGPQTSANYYSNEIGGSAMLGFSPFSWINLGLGYEYRERNSNIDSESFRSNTYFLKATAAI